ncbi:MAG: hypothetical protein AAF750_09275 [Planctomycetota bacterium]
MRATPFLIALILVLQVPSPATSQEVPEKGYVEHPGLFRYLKADAEKTYEYLLQAGSPALYSSTGELLEPADNGGNEEVWSYELRLARLRYALYYRWYVDTRAQWNSLSAEQLNLPDTVQMSGEERRKRLLGKMDELQSVLLEITKHHESLLDFHDDDNAKDFSNAKTELFSLYSSLNTRLPLMMLVSSKLAAVKKGDDN